MFYHISKYLMDIYFDVVLRYHSLGRAWYGMENGMEWNGNFGMEYGRCQNGMEDNLPYFHTNSILDFVHCIYRKIHTDVG